MSKNRSWHEHRRAAGQGWGQKGATCRDTTVPSSLDRFISTSCHEPVLAPLYWKQPLLLIFLLFSHFQRWNSISAFKSWPTSSATFVSHLKLFFFFLSPSFHACKIGGDNTHWGFLRVPLENWVPRYSMNITFHIANDTQLCYFASIWQTCHLRKQFRKPMRFSFLISKMKMTIIKLISWACWRMKRVNVWNMLGTGPSTQYMY